MRPDQPPHSSPPSYILGYYTKKNCPRYLEEANYAKLKADLQEGRLELYHGTIEDRLEICEGEKFTVASLLDHMDWMPGATVQVSSSDAKSRPQWKQTLPEA